MTDLLGISSVPLTVDEASTTEMIVESSIMDGVSGEDVVGGVSIIVVVERVGSVGSVGMVGGSESIVGRGAEMNCHMLM